ncbi:MAG: hypothetical protein AAGI30_04740 [Planctomycetota bacterium]
MSVRGTKALQQSIDAVDALMERASEALVATRYFEAERLCLDAMAKARKASLFERMARLTLPLLEARRQKRLGAVDSGHLTCFDHESMPAEFEPTAGCYVFEPLLVAADARDLRDRADAAEIPVLVVAREPRTQIGLWPVAMIGPITVRTRLRPPPDEVADLTWVQAALEALGDEALASLDQNRPAWHRVDQLLDRLAAVPEHEKLHQSLEATCREAADEVQPGESPDSASRSRPVVVEEEFDEQDEG